MAEHHSEDSPLLRFSNVFTESVPVDVRIIATNGGNSHSASQDDVTSETRKYILPTSIPEIHTSCSADWLHSLKDEGFSVFAHSYPNLDRGNQCGAFEEDLSFQLLTCPQQGHGVLLSNVSTQPRSAVSAVDFMAPLAKNESLDCRCDDIDQRCNCQASSFSVLQSSVCDPLLQSDTTKVTFHIEECDDELPQIGGLIANSSDALDCASSSTSFHSNNGKKCPQFPPNIFARIPSYPKTEMLSTSSSTASMPMCRICHFPQGEVPDALISPCRCSGTMQFIHESCLMKWIDVSKSKKGAACELCNYQYNRHKKFRLRHWELPTCSRVDKFLHLVFILCLIVMATCATITVYCFKQDRYIKNSQDTELTKSEIITLICGVLFFVAFFLAMYVEVKAKDTLYRLFTRFVRLNQTWHIDDYNKQEDTQNAPV